MDFIRKKIKFKKDIYFNFVSHALDVNNHDTIFSGAWFDKKILQSVMQIRNVGKNEEFKYVYDQLKKHCIKKQKNYDLDLFMSWVMGTRSTTHKDEYDVWILGCHGRTMYKVGYKEIIVEKGDLLYIPKNTTHTAIGLDPRIILSLGIYND